MANTDFMFVAIDEDAFFPLVVAPTMEDLKAALDERYDGDERNKCLGFTPYKFPDVYEGFYEYEYYDHSGMDHKDTIKVYSIDYYKQTK